MANKVYYLDRDGATPQVVPANTDEKMKVYDDYDSIDTSELVEGEIVSTKETSADGSNVYDYIDSEIESAASYSTTETLTGGKWIDGKPIYKISKEGTASFSNVNWTNITLFNDGIQRKVVKLDVICESCCLRPNYLEITNALQLSTSTSTGNGSTASNVKYILTIEYTKATD